MKLAYTVCTPDTKGKYLAYRGDLEEMLAALKQIGYDGVEAFVRDPRAMDQAEFGRVLAKNGLQLAAVGTGPMATEDKITFSSPDKKIRDEAITRVKAAVDFASLFGAQVNIGKLRGDVNKGGAPILLRQFRDDAFREVCDYALTKNTLITLEPQCRFAVDNLNSTQEAIAWVKEMELPNLYIMLDIFHMNIEDKSQAASFIDGKDLNIHVHFADNHRGVPGTGQIGFADAVRVLKALGYSRYISLEIEQEPDCFRAAGASYEYIKRLLKED